MTSYEPKRMPQAVLDELAAMGYRVDGRGGSLLNHYTIGWNYHLGLWESTCTDVNRALMAAQWDEAQRRLANGAER